MKRRSFIASLFAVTAAPVVARAIPAKAAPVVGKIEGPESVGRYEAVESHDADGPIVLSGNVELSESWHVNFVEEPCDIGNFRSLRAVSKTKTYRISCDSISDWFRVLVARPGKRLVFSVNTAVIGCESRHIIGGYAKSIDYESWIGSHRWTLVIEADHINASTSALHTTSTTEAMR